jgi:hypothetical protein
MSISSSAIPIPLFLSRRDGIPLRKRPRFDRAKLGFHALVAGDGIAVSAHAAVISLLLALFPLPAAANELENLVSSSGRESNPRIIGLLSTSDLETQLCIAKALGQREDPYAADIIEAISARFDGKTESNREHLLRVVLFSLYGPDAPPGARQERVEANRAAIDSLLKIFPGFHDPQLKSALIGLIPLLGVREYDSLVVATAGTIIQTMRNHDGIPPAETGLLSAILSFFQADPRMDFLEPCISIADSSRDARIVRLARDTAKRIVSAG